MTICQNNHNQEKIIEDTGPTRRFVLMLPMIRPSPPLMDIAQTWITIEHRRCANILTEIRPETAVHREGVPWVSGHRLTWPQQIHVH